MNEHSHISTMNNIHISPRSSNICSEREKKKPHWLISTLSALSLEKIALLANPIPSPHLQHLTKAGAQLGLNKYL